MRSISAVHGRSSLGALPLCLRASVLLETCIAVSVSDYYSKCKNNFKWRGSTTFHKNKKWACKKFSEAGNDTSVWHRKLGFIYRMFMIMLEAKIIRVWNWFIIGTSRWDISISRTVDKILIKTHTRTHHIELLFMQYAWGYALHLYSYKYICYLMTRAWIFTWNSV